MIIHLERTFILFILLNFLILHLWKEYFVQELNVYLSILTVCKTGLKKKGTLNKIIAVGLANCHQTLENSAVSSFLLISYLNRLDKVVPFTVTKYTADCIQSAKDTCLVSVL